MKFGYVLSVVGAVASSNITLEHVYGEAKPVSSMRPYWQQRKGRAGFSPSFLEKRSADNCVFPIDVVLVQDATSSFDDNFNNMATTQLSLMINALSTTHPGSRVGVVSFRDIPIWSLGEPRTDYCQKLEEPLTDDLSALTALYSKLQSIGGGDPPENQFGALIAAANYANIGWGANPDAANLAVVVTDAAPHFNADGFNRYNLAPNPGTFNEATADADCTKFYYPSPEEVRNQLVGHELYLGSLVYDGQYDQYAPRDSWMWFNNYLGQLPAFYHDMNEDSSNFWEVLSHVISQLEDVECGSATTTTTETPLTVTLDGDTLPPPLETSSEAPVETTTTTPGTQPPSPCEVCPNPCPPEGCDPCCLDGVLIKLRHRPARLHLEVENPPLPESTA